MGYTVLKDTREQQGWVFTKSANCNGTVETTLPTGDYTLEEYKSELCIEHKGSSGEFARNIVENRFVEELKRMQEIEYPFIVLEFTMSDIIHFPRNSGIPPALWPKLRISPFFLLKKFMEFQYQYKAKIILAGSHGKDVASSIFKRMIEYGSKSERKERASKDTAANKG
jgi:ERCC4-type nuclease